MRPAADVVLTSDRLRLVPITHDVAAAVVAGDLAVIRCAPGFPHADTLDALAPFVASGDRTGLGGWWITLRDDGSVIGDCGWHGGPDPSGAAEIGYGLAAPFRGRGYGSEAVRTLLGWVVGQPEVRRVTAQVLVDNMPSRRLLERLGFAVDHVDAPHVWYALDAAG